MATVRITVLKRTVNCEICEEFGDVSWKLRGGCEPCGTHEDGQQFVSRRGEKPDGFCSWAWADIQRDVTMLRLGGARDWLKKPGTWLSACTDGMKPVVFLLERLRNGHGDSR